MRRNNDSQALTTQFFCCSSLDFVSNFFGCCAWRIECGKTTLPTIQTLHSFVCAHCLDTNIIYIFLRDTSEQQMEKWIIKRLNEMKKRTERERKKRFEYKQTNKIEKRQPNTHLIFGSEWNQIGETREREKMSEAKREEERESKKKNNISSSTVVYFDLNTYGFCAHFFHSFATVSKGA